MKNRASEALVDYSRRPIEPGAYMDNSQTVWDVSGNAEQGFQIRTEGFSGALGPDIAATLAPMQICSTSCHSYKKSFGTDICDSMENGSVEAPLGCLCLKDASALQEECCV